MTIWPNVQHGNQFNLPQALYMILQLSFKTNVLCYVGFMSQVHLIH